uniref:Apoptotic chromatin condensation inducer in the nucleus (inferred by orthology to a human protein) n=1 Tax=Nippostrongylus brasiliensis TaxID=27835 RepID=A0A0N4XIK6_NIPBR
LTIFLVSAKPVEENGAGNGGDLEELDYGEAEVEAEGDAEDKDTKDEVFPFSHSMSCSLRHPESEFIHIRGLTRPFTDRALKAEIMKSGGQIVNFWIDGVKSHCIVQMQSIEEAREVRLAMHNTQWPAANPKMLSVQFDTKENVSSYCFLELTARNERILLPNYRLSIFYRLHSYYLGFQKKDERKRPRSETPPFSRGATEKRERHLEEEKEKREEEKPVKTADSLFMKTKAQPAIYFLPLTEEESAKKSEKRRNLGADMRDGPRRVYSAMIQSILVWV